MAIEAVTYATVRNPNWIRMLKVLFVVIVYINLTKVLLGSRFFTLAADGLTLCFAIYLMSWRRSRAQPFHGVEKWTLTFMTFALLAMFHPNIPDLTVGMEGYRRLAFQMLGVIVGFSIGGDRRSFFSVVRFLTWISVPVLIYSIKQFVFMSDFDLQLIESNTADIVTVTIFDRIRAFGIFNGPFHLGLFGGFIFWLSFALFREDRKIVYLVIMLLATCSVVASLTRGSIIALVLSVAVIYIFFIKSGRWKTLFSVLVLVPVLVGLFTYFSDELQDVDQVLETVSDVESIGTDSRLESRFHVYEEGLEAVATGPFGYGMGSAGDAMEFYFEPTGRFHMTTHNLFLRAAIEMGWFGLIVYGYLFTFFSLAAWRLNGRDSNMAVVFTGMLFMVLITGITGSTIEAYPMNLIFWIFMGILVRNSLKNSPTWTN